MNLFTLGVICSLILAGSVASASRVLFLDDQFPDSSSAFQAALRQEAGKGFDVQDVDAAGLAAAMESAKGPGDILVLPNSVWFPSQANGELLAFLKRGSHLLAIGGPAFSRQVVSYKGQWLDENALGDRLAELPGQKILDFSDWDISKWHPAASGDGAADYDIVPSGDPRVGACLHAKIRKLHGWASMTGPSLGKPFTSANCATVFWAKGGPRTPELMVEWREKDSSRWIAVIKLSTQWKRYALNPGSFAYWQDNPSKGRGGPGDRFNPANADGMSFALGASHSVQTTGVSHEYWVADVQAVENEYAGVDFRPPVLESLCPTYKIHETRASRLTDCLSGEAWDADTSVVSTIPLPAGLGSDAVRPFRCATLLSATDAKGQPRGLAGHLYVNTSTDYPGSLWAYFGLSQDYLERNAEKCIPVVMSALERMGRGALLANAGSDSFGYFDGDSAGFAAYVLNLSDVPANVDVSVDVRSESGVAVHSHAAEVQVPVRNIQSPLRVDLGSKRLSAGRYVVTTLLKSQDKTVDRIEHEFTVVSTAPAPADEFVQASGDKFYLHGRPWQANGINYWPRYCTGRDNYNLYWGDPSDYNPAIIEQDLALAQSLGLTMLSAWYMRPEQAGPIIDFLDRARRHDLKINLFMPGLSPLEPNFSFARDMIVRARLTNNPAMFAYDIGWEVKVGTRDQRKQYDPLWQKWVIDQYGSVDTAVADWKFKPELVDGTLVGVTDEQASKDGPWRTMVAAYRRFWDDEISKRYMQCRAEIRSIDRRHLIGVRSGCGGNGMAGTQVIFPFDLLSGVRHLDFTSPEGYGLDWVGYPKGGFTSEYARFVSGGKPVFWAEYGTSIWPRRGAEELERQRQCVAGMVEMARSSDCAGSAGWWWPGGFRWGEVSDFGLINSDGTPRPAALEYAKCAAKPLGRSYTGPDDIITIDRDEHVSGYVGVFQQFKDRYAEDLAQGRKVILRTAGTGTTSVDVPLTAVGNLPYNGHNPLKYLNAEFDYIKINGRVVHDGETIGIPRGERVWIEASVGNIGEATWLAPAAGRDGEVYLVEKTSTGEGRAPFARDTAYLGTAVVPRSILTASLKDEANYEFRMCAWNRAVFGEVFRITLKPK